MKPSKDSALDSRGLLWGFISYALWGVFPVYWKLLSHLPALHILGHRMAWSFVFYLLIFLGTSRQSLRSLFRQTRREWMLCAIASGLLTFNWGLYIHAVNTGHILEGSLAYFINPILNVAVGVLFFKESFPFMLKLSVLCAALGVGAKILVSPGFPWISLALALSFCAYGVAKKLLKIPARSSSALEGALSLVPAFLAISYFHAKLPEPMPAGTWALLIGGGVVTGLPLFLFSYAAQRVPYSVMGMLQFVAPSLQFLVAILMFHEPLSAPDLLAFGFIWVGVLFYGAYQIHGRRCVKTEI